MFLSFIGFVHPHILKRTENHQVGGWCRGEPEALEGVGVEPRGGAGAVGPRRREEHQRPGQRGVLPRKHCSYGPVQPLHRDRLPPEVALVPACSPLGASAMQLAGVFRADGAQLDFAWLVKDHPDVYVVITLCKLVLSFLSIFK